MPKKEYLLGGLAALLSFALMAYAWVRRADIAVLAPHGAIGAAERSVIVTTVILCSVVIVFVYLLLFLFAWRYHDEHPEVARTHDPEWDHESLWGEFVWWLVPGAIILALSVIMIRSTYALDPYKPLPGGKELPVQVIALNWKWLFIYPEQGVASVNALEIPAGMPVHFYLTADAPMNSFWVPKLGGQIAVMPGMTTQLNLVANEIGDYEGFSANISGEGFSGMTFTVHAVPQNEFDSWTEGLRTSNVVLTREVYDQLALPSANHPVTFYSSMDPSLFDSVRMKGMAPEPAKTRQVQQRQDMSDMDGMDI